MLVLSRKVGEKIFINGDITVTVLEFDGCRIRLGIDAPGHVRVLRSELVGRSWGSPAPDDYPLDDPDLAAKPAEWETAEPALSRCRPLQWP